MEYLSFKAAVQSNQYAEIINEDPEQKGILWKSTYTYIFPFIIKGPAKSEKISLAIGWHIQLNIEHIIAAFKYPWVRKGVELPILLPKNRKQWTRESPGACKIMVLKCKGVTEGPHVQRVMN